MHLYLWQARISWYGVGGTFAQNKLGERFLVRSKKVGHEVVNFSERHKHREQKEVPSRLESAQSLVTDIEVRGGRFLTHGTEIKVYGLEKELLELIRTAEGKTTLVSNLKEIYYFYIGGHDRKCGYERMRSTMQRCFDRGVYAKFVAKDRHVRRAMLEPLRAALSSPAPDVSPTDLDVIFRQDGARTELAQTDCFLDAVCNDAVDCFPIHVAVQDGGTTRVVMGGVFYFAFKDGVETRPRHTGFLEQAATQVCHKSPYQP